MHAPLSDHCEAHHARNDAMLALHAEPLGRLLALPMLTPPPEMRRAYQAFSARHAVCDSRLI